MMRSFLFLTFAGMRLLSAQTALPTEWIDPDTGHRVIRLSREDGTASLYFHQNAYSADGKKLVVTNPHGIATINLATREIDQVVEGRVNILVTGHKTGQIYYTKEGAIFATDLDTHATHEVAKIPVQAGRGGAFAVNADETMLVGIAADPDGKTVPRTPPPGGHGRRPGGELGQGHAQDALHHRHQDGGIPQDLHRERLDQPPSDVAHRPESHHVLP